jgi:hypothetical protein
MALQAPLFLNECRLLQQITASVVEIQQTTLPLFKFKEMFISTSFELLSARDTLDLNVSREVELTTYRGPSCDNVTLLGCPSCQLGIFIMNGCSSSEETGKFLISLPAFALSLGTK